MGQLSDCLPCQLVGSSWADTDDRIGSKVVQIGPKWDNAGTFHIRFQYILAR